MGSWLFRVSHCPLALPSVAAGLTYQGPLFKILTLLKLSVSLPFSYSFLLTYCYGLNGVPPNSYVEVLSPSTSECDYLEKGL